MDLAILEEEGFALLRMAKQLQVGSTVNSAGNWTGCADGRRVYVLHSQ
jgi:hypothetical protein